MFGVSSPVRNGARDAARAPEVGAHLALERQGVVDEQLARVEVDEVRVLLLDLGRADDGRPGGGIPPGPAEGIRVARGPGSSTGRARAAAASPAGRAGVRTAAALPGPPLLKRAAVSEAPRRASRSGEPNPPPRRNAEAAPARAMVSSLTRKSGGFVARRAEGSMARPSPPPTRPSARSAIVLFRVALASAMRWYGFGASQAVRRDGGGVRGSFSRR